MLLGAKTFVGSDVTIIDWQHAPLAEIFFAFQEGEEYEVELGDRSLGGILTQRNLVEFEAGEPIEIVTPDRILTRRNRDGWVELEDDRPPLLFPRSEADRARPFSPVLVQLDPDQRRAVELPASKSLLVLGEAGYGKTTVALHRLAFLTRQALASRQPFRAVVIVPTEGLRRLAESMLERLGVESTDVQTFDQWIWTQAQQVFAELPERTSDDAAATVIRFKRHPALRDVLPELAARTGRSSAQEEERGDPCAIREDLLHLWGDRLLLETRRRSLEWSADPAHDRRPDRAYARPVQRDHRAGVLPHRRGAPRDLDGLAIDRGTPMQDAATIDAEDCAVLFELNRLRIGSDATAKGRLATYRHIVVDEAQELAPLELAVIGRALSDGGALTIAGDERQQIDPAAYFDGWSATVSELGVQDHHTVTLEASYRCPPEISAFGRGLFRSETPGQPPPPLEETGDSRRIVFSRFPSECHLATRLTDQLSELLVFDPRATVAIICRAAPEARGWSRTSRRGLATGLALDGEFDFLPGISVTCVADVKGLEFDYVVVPDASAARYPDTPEARRALYVAVTRAIHQVWLSTVGTWSPILPAQRASERLRGGVKRFTASRGRLA